MRPVVRLWLSVAAVVGLALLGWLYVVVTLNAA
jgi:hypothetical protein